MNRKSKHNIFLIGMMSSGKTTVGKQIAQKLNMEFVDIDDIVEKVTDTPIPEIFEKYGEKRFRDMEGAFFREKAMQTNQVFATGGGVVLDNKNRQVLKNSGITILLRTRSDSLSKRIRSTVSRPLLQDADDLEDRLAFIWDERKSYYESTAHFIVDTDKLSPEIVVQIIIHNFQKINEDN